MTNKTPQPLSEKELREKIEDIVVDTDLHPVDQSLRIMKLFIQERQAWGEYVIGEDIPIKPGTYHGKTREVLDNYLRSIQRKRNTQKEQER